MTNLNSGNHKIIVLLGCAGAGKGTISQLLKKMTGHIHTCSGDMIREEIRSGSEQGLRFKQLITNGNRIDDDIIIEIVLKRLKPLIESGENIILDGFPQSNDQANALDDLFEILKVRDKVDFIYLSVDPEIAKNRIMSRAICGQCGEIYNMKTKIPTHLDQCDMCSCQLLVRVDDNKAAAEKRVLSYAEFMKPVLDRYKSEKKLIEIDANNEINKVFKEFLHKLSL